jgi:hypothetical protein
MHDLQDALINPVKPGTDRDQLEQLARSKAIEAGVAEARVAELTTRFSATLANHLPNAVKSAGQTVQSSAEA